MGWRKSALYQMPVQRETQPGPILHIRLSNPLDKPQRKRQPHFYRRNTQLNERCRQWGRSHDSNTAQPVKPGLLPQDGLAGVLLVLFRLTGTFRLTTSNLTGMMTLEESEELARSYLSRSTGPRRCHRRNPLNFQRMDIEGFQSIKIKTSKLCSQSQQNTDAKTRHR